MSLSFFKDLFIVEGAPEGSVLTFLPFLITALAVGVVLASVYFTVWQLISARLTRRLHEADATAAADAKTLEELGIAPESLRSRVLRFLLRSHACILYKNVSCDELDAQRLAMMVEAGEVSNPATYSDAPAEAAPDTAYGTVCGGISDACPTETGASDAGEEPAATPTRKQKLRPRIRMRIPPETRFYIIPTRLSYVEEHLLKFSLDDLWGLFFTLAGSVLLWLGAMALLDPLTSFLIK